MAIELDAGARNWIRRYAARNYWRVPSWYELEDLVQDGYWQWARCCARYPHVETQRHMMALFKQCFHSHITDLANKRTKLTELPVARFAPESDDAFWDALRGIDDEVATITLMLSQAPAEVKNLIKMLASDAGMARLRRPHRRRLDGTRETTNQFLGRCLGYDPTKVNLPAMVRDYLTAH